MKGWEQLGRPPGKRPVRRARSKRSTRWISAPRSFCSNAILPSRQSVHSINQMNSHVNKYKPPFLIYIINVYRKYLKIVLRLQRSLVDFSTYSEIRKMRCVIRESVQTYRRVWTALFLRSASVLESICGRCCRTIVCSRRRSRRRTHPSV